MNSNGQSRHVGRDENLLGRGSILVGELLLPAALCCLQVSHAALCTLSAQSPLPDYLLNTTRTLSVCPHRRCENT